MAQPVEGVTVVPDENNIQSWQVIIRGPVSFGMDAHPSALASRLRWLALLILEVSLKQLMQTANSYCLWSSAMISRSKRRR